MSAGRKQSTEAAVREIRRKTRRKFAPEEKIRIVLEGLRGEQSISELCRREGIASNLYYRWSKDFLEAGKKQLAILKAAARKRRWGCLWPCAFGSRRKGRSAGRRSARAWTSPRVRPGGR